MDIKQLTRWSLTVGVAALLAGCANDATNETTNAISAAAFTTSDTTRGGCLDSPNGVNCNHYASKTDVFSNGGPVDAHMADGSYFFAVLQPGFQHDGFVDGARGNLSDTTAGGTAGDLGSGDPVANRTFTVSGGTITYSGTHASGTSPNGHRTIQVAPFDDTGNPGGEYILAICRTGASRPSECRFDAFQVRGAADEDGGAPSEDAGGGATDAGGGTSDAGGPVDDIPTPP